MRLKEALDEKLYDVRLRDRLLAEKKLESKDLETYLNTLKDEKENAEHIEID